MPKDELLYNHGHNILRHLILYQIFFSPQVKRSVIISNKRDIYELPHELPNHLCPRKKKKQKQKLKDLRKLGNIRKILKLHRVIA